MHCKNFADPIALTSSAKQTKVRTVRVVVCELQKKESCIAKRLIQYTALSCELCQLINELTNSNNHSDWRSESLISDAQISSWFIPTYRIDFIASDYDVDVVSIK